MKNLIKNVVRSFTKNKISILGLIFLLFFGLGVFCTMNNTTTNIRNEYTSLAQEGQLHDFTAAELYDVGTAEYVEAGYGISYVTPEGSRSPTYTPIDDLSTLSIAESQYYFGAEPGTVTGRTYYVPIPRQNIIYNEEDNFFYTYRTYTIILSKTLSSGLYRDYATDHEGTSLVKFQFNTEMVAYETVPEDEQNLADIEDEWDRGNQPTPDQRAALCNNSFFSREYASFHSFIDEKSNSIYSLMMSNDTPLYRYINNNFGNEIEERYFKSVNVTTAEDNIYYKIINSNPEDQIDKMVLFDDPNHRTGNQLFSVNDWAPHDSAIVFYDLDNKIVGPGTSYTVTNPDSSTITFTVPSTFNELVQMPLYYVDGGTHAMNRWTTDGTTPARLEQYIYSQIIQIRMKRMFVGEFSDQSLFPVKPMIKDAAGITVDREKYFDELFNHTTSQTIYNGYYDYLDTWYYSKQESITLSANGNVVFTWSGLGGSPSTCTISNWTTKVAIVNPQHLEKTSKRVMDPSMLNNFEPFRQWYKTTYGWLPSGEISQDAAKKWFNTLSSDQFGFWVNPNTRLSEWTEMEYTIPSSGQRIIVKRGLGENEWNGINRQYIADCEGYDLIIWGCGLTPDFMYPVVDISRPTPNPAKECLIYSNDVGYNGIKLAFANSPVEEYIVGRFKIDISDNRKREIINSINDWVHTPESGMILPDETKCAYFANDTDNLLNCSGFRVAYIPNLVNVIEIVSIILCSFMGILCLIICFVIIKRYVENNRVNIGIMRANGIKKWKIAFSLFPFALLPALVGGVAAYFTGLFLQAPMLTLFSNYWMLPTPLIGFSLAPFLVCIFVPFILFTIICIISTLLVLRTKAVDLMKAGSEFKVNAFSRIAKKPFKHFGVLTRFRVALAFNSISRLLVLGAMSCLTMSSLVFAMTSFDKLNQSKNINSTQFDYNFNIELTTPTSTGGAYSTYDYSAEQDPGIAKGFGWSNPDQYLFNTYWNTSDVDYRDSKWYTDQGKRSYAQLTKPYMSDEFIGGYEDYEDPDLVKDIIGNNGLIQIPSQADATGQNQDLTYLQNKINSRLTLDYNIGMPGVAASNPWDIALALMPANSRNIAAQSFNNMVNETGKRVHAADLIFRQVLADKGIIVPESGVIYEQRQGQYRNEIIQAQEQAGKWCYPVEFYDIFSGYYYINRFTTFFSYNKESDSYTLITDLGTIGDGITRFNSSFTNLLKTIYTDFDLMRIEYPIVYGSVPINWGKEFNDDVIPDETYTYIKGNITNLSNERQFDSTHEIKLEGIKKDSQYIFLTDNNGHELNSRLFDTNYLHSLNINETIYPIIINAYAAHKYGLSIGDTITLNVNNTVDRIVQAIHSQQVIDNSAKFKVVGVSVGTTNEAFYTTQDVANNVVGLPNGESWNKTHRYMIWTDLSPSGEVYSGWNVSNRVVPALADLSGIDANTKGKITIQKFTDGESWAKQPLDESINALSEVKIPVGFNGIYSQNKYGKPITSGISLYSYTGMYLGTSVYRSQGDSNKFTDVLSFGTNLAIANIMSGINDNKYTEANIQYLNNQLSLDDYINVINEFIAQIVKYYGETSMITTICGATDVAASDLIYNNLISTFNLAETAIMAIVIPITIIIVAVISNLIIDDSKKMAAMLKALGYSDGKNLMSILALFVPTIFIGLILAVPLSFGLAFGYQAIIFNTANILVDITQKWWYYIAAMGGIGVILMATYGIGYATIKRDRLVDRIK